MIEDMGKTYKLVNSNLDRLEFKEAHKEKEENKRLYSNLDRLEFKVHSHLGYCLDKLIRI